MDFELRSIMNLPGCMPWPWGVKSGARATIKISSYSILMIGYQILKSPMPVISFVVQLPMKNDFQAVIIVIMWLKLDFLL